MKLILLTIFGALCGQVVTQEYYEEDNDDINVFEVEDTCPGWSSNNTTSCPIQEQLLSPCAEDFQCKIGSRCCEIPGCSFKHCVDTTESSVSEPSPIGVARTLNKRPRLRVVRCVPCSCQRLCRSDSDCRRGRRRTCYRNTCSSYCIRA